jgi:hypothetical protein
VCIDFLLKLRQNLVALPWLPWFVSLQTATAAQQTLVASEPSSAAFSAMRTPAPLRPAVNKERLSLKAQVIFEGSWKKIEEKYKEVGLDRRASRLFVSLPARFQSNGRIMLPWQWAGRATCRVRIGANVQCFVSSAAVGVPSRGGLVERRTRLWQGHQVSDSPAAPALAGSKSICRQLPIGRKP